MNQLRFLNIDIKNVRVNVRPHANKRLVQRFRLYLKEEEIAQPKYFIERIFRKSEIYKKHIFSPFIYNKQASVHGTNSFYCDHGVWRLSCWLNDDNSVTIRTILKRETNV